MAYNIRKNIDRIINLLKDEGSEACRMIYIKGGFGTGKTELIAEIGKKIYEMQISDIIFNYYDAGNCIYFPEFVYTLGAGFVPVYNQFDTFESNEIFINRNKFLEILNDARSADKQLYKAIIEFNKLVSTPEFESDNTLKNRTYNVDDFINNYPLLKKSDKRLIFDIYNMSSESFIVDLMQKYFLSIPEIETYKKLKILFLIDDYDKIAGNVNNWLSNYFFSYVYDKSFGDFQYYDINTIDKTKKVSDYFEFSFIIAGREDFPESEYSKNCYILELHPYTKEQMIEYLHANNMEKTADIDLLFEHSYGVPYVVDLLSEMGMVTNGEPDDLYRAEQMAGRKILKSFSEEKQDWIRCAAFFEEFDQDALQYFSLIGKKNIEAFEFFKNSHDLCESYKEDQSKIQIKPLIRDFIRKETYTESPVTHREFFKISETYYTYEKLMHSFQKEEQEIIIKLAYFKKFDKIFAVQSLLGEKAGAARKIIEKYPSLFIENKYSYSMDENVALIILAMESKKPSEDYENTIKLIDDTWIRYKHELNQQLSNCNKTIKEIKNSIQLTEAEFLSVSNEIDSNIAAEKIIDTKIKDLKSKIDLLVKQGKLAPASIMITASTALFIFSYLFSDSIKMGNLIIILIVAIMFGIIGGLKLIKWFGARARMEDLAISRNNLRSLESEKFEKEGKYNVLLSQSAKNKESKANSEELILQKEMEIEELKAKLEECFVR